MRSFIYQLRRTADTLTVRFVFYGFLFLVIIHSLGVISRFWGMDAVSMIEPMKLRIMYDETNQITIRLIQFFPFLAVIPAGFSYFDDSKNRTDIIIRTRSGNSAYVRDSLLSSFVVSFFTYWIPFMLEIGILSVAMDIGISRDPSGLSYYQSGMQSYIGNYFFADLYKTHPVLHAMAEVSVWAAIVGALASFAVAVSFFGIKIRALVFLPVLMVVYAVGFVGDYLGTGFTTNYMWYLLGYDGHEKNDLFIFVLLAALIVSCVICGIINARRDRL